MPTNRGAGGYYNDKQHQSASAKNSKPTRGKTNAAFDSQVNTRSASWPQTGDRKTNEAVVDVNNKPNRRNKATV
jgi:hypothetical protein